MPMPWLMRLLPYRLFCASMVIAVLATFVVWSLLWWDGEPFAVALLVFAAVYFAALGMAIVTDWNGATQQLRAFQRMQGSKKGRLWRYVCRDTRGWWRAVGVICLGVGTIYGLLAAQIIRT